MIDELHIFGIFPGLTFVNIFPRLNQFLDIKKPLRTFFCIIDRHNISLMNKRLEYNK